LTDLVYFIDYFYPNQTQPKNSGSILKIMREIALYLLICLFIVIPIQSFIPLTPIRQGTKITSHLHRSTILLSSFTPSAPVASSIPEAISPLQSRGVNILGVEASEVIGFQCAFWSLLEDTIRNEGASEVGVVFEQISSQAVEALAADFKTLQVGMERGTSEASEKEGNRCCSNDGSITYFTTSYDIRAFNTAVGLNN